MSVRRRSLLVAPAVLAAPSALAQGDWPQRPVRVIVPYAAGGPSDIVARLLAPGLATVLGQPVVVDNRPGAGSMLGTEAAARATDGHTVLLADSPFTIIPAVQERVPYDAKADLAPVTLIGAVTMILAVNSGFPARSASALAEAGKVRPDTVSFGSSGIGSLSHLLPEWFGQLTGARFANVAYRGAGPALQDVAAGQINAIFSSPASIEGPLRAGQVTPIAVAAPRRLPAMPDVPTLLEGGIDLSADNWFGVLAPTSIPVEARARLAAAIARVNATEEVRARLSTLGLEPRPMGPDAFARVLDAEFYRWAEVARAAGVSVR
ncbi:Bug family tripartite tricarboxylate transporter substrate binding protein [Muricoccus aerilatus]|uniref:Bug family tripartite tricarboxylate transporter substrate binding protein n=1 Tax=Muricoccus aerilatus TaxID=452982 RepID=UPI0006950CBB|nr:tripartite tricarboxylate transporter substrate binding protein [Roseomonas aerilata]